MRIKKHMVLLASLAIALTSCGSEKSETYAIQGNQYIPDGYTGKRTYNALLGMPLKRLNSAVTMNGEDGEHIANFVDGLVSNDEYGRLNKALAEKIEVNEDFDEYTFTLKSGIKWITSDGEQYVGMVNGRKSKQFVTAEDFVFAIKKSLDFRNNSQSYYLPAMFLKGGYEYYCYTYCLSLRETNEDIKIFGSKLDTPEKIANGIVTLAKLQFNIDLDPITADDIPEIRDFKRVGIEASKKDGKSVVTYKLQNPSRFFLSVLTYSAFLPINEAFVNEVGFKNFGYSNEEFLYNGAFYCTEWDANKVVYRKNPYYWDEENVHIDNVNYGVINNEISNDFVRNEYENGRIDAFGITQNDVKGWETYVKGPDGTGTIENPASDLAYSREIETVDSTFMFELNLSRNDPKTSALPTKSSLTSVELKNTDNALKINAVRDLVLNGIDAKLYNKRWGAAEELRDQYQMWTYVPKGFTSSNTGDDYIEYVYRAYQNEFGGTLEEIRELLKQGVVKDTSAEHTVKVRALAEKAKFAIERVNADGGVMLPPYDNSSSKEKITLPIKFEYLGIPDAEQKDYDAAWMEKFNEDANVCTTNPNHVSDTLPACADGKYPYFEIVTNEKVTLNTYAEMGEKGQYHIYISGWGADYADPLTYLNTFVTGGDMSSYTGTRTPVIDYKVDEAGNVEKLDNLLSEYDSLVSQGKAINDNDDARFTYFGEAEVELLFDVHIMRPLYMMGQGWSVSVSKAAGYETPTAAYGLSSYKLKGIYVLTEPMKAAERKAARALYLQKKAEALQDKDYSIYTIIKK